MPSQGEWAGRSVANNLRKHTHTGHRALRSQQSNARQKQAAVNKVTRFSLQLHLLGKPKNLNLLEL